MTGRRSRDLWDEDGKLEAPCGDFPRSQQYGPLQTIYPFKINRPVVWPLDIRPKCEIAKSQLYLMYKNDNLFSIINLFIDCVPYFNVNIILFNTVS